MVSAAIQAVYRLNTGKETILVTWKARAHRQLLASLRAPKATITAKVHSLIFILAAQITRGAFSLIIV